MSYNGIKLHSKSELLPADLMDELANSGVKYNPEDVVMVTKNYDGHVMWLETGNEHKGLTHIQERYTRNFRDTGYDSSEEIQSLLKTVLNSQPIKVSPKNGGLEAIYNYNGHNYTVGYGTNGYIVSFYPSRTK